MQEAGAAKAHDVALPLRLDAEVARRRACERAHFGHRQRVAAHDADVGHGHVAMALARPVS
jgi:hypothetical protein